MAFVCVFVWFIAWLDLIDCFDLLYSLLGRACILSETFFCFSWRLLVRYIFCISCSCSFFNCFVSLLFSSLALSQRSAVQCLPREICNMEFLSSSACCVCVCLCVLCMYVTCVYSFKVAVPTYLSNLYVLLIWTDLSVLSTVQLIWGYGVLGYLLSRCV